MQQIIIKWLGHACFKLTFGDWSVVIDPFEDNSVPGFLPIQESAIEVLCSHNHFDHNAKSIIKQIKLFAPAPQMKKIKTFHDDQQGALHGENIVHVFEYAGMRVAHFGDLGHLLTPLQIQEIGKLDLALLPVGGIYTIDAQMAYTVAQQTQAKVIIPMHYKSDIFGFEEIATIDAFLSLQDNVVKLESDTLILTPQTPAQTVVLSLNK